MFFRNTQLASESCKTFIQMKCQTHSFHKFEKICIDPACLKTLETGQNSCFLCSKCYDIHKGMHSAGTLYLDFKHVFSEQLNEDIENIMQEEKN